MGAREELSRWVCWFGFRGGGRILFEECLLGCVGRGRRQRRVEMLEGVLVMAWIGREGRDTKDCNVADACIGIGVVEDVVDDVDVEKLATDDGCDILIFDAV